MAHSQFEGLSLRVTHDVLWRCMHAKQHRMLAVSHADSLHAMLLFPSVLSALGLLTSQSECKVTDGQNQCETLSRSGEGE